MRCCALMLNYSSRRQYWQLLTHSWKKRWAEQRSVGSQVHRRSCRSLEKRSPRRQYWQLRTHSWKKRWTKQCSMGSQVHRRSCRSLKKRWLWQKRLPMIENSWKRRWSHSAFSISNRTACFDHLGASRPRHLRRQLAVPLGHPSLEAPLHARLEIHSNASIEVPSQESPDFPADTLSGKHRETPPLSEPAAFASTEAGCQSQRSAGTLGIYPASGPQCGEKREEVPRSP